LLCASWDGVGFVNYRDHLYLPIAWVEAEYPASRPLCGIIRSIVEAAEGE